MHAALTYHRFVIQCSVNKQPIPTKCEIQIKQDAQLSQRDRAAGCVIVFAKSRTLELGDNDLRTL